MLRYAAPLIALLISQPLLAQSEAAVAATLSGEAMARKDENDPAFYLELISGMQQRRLFFASLAHLDAFDLKWPNDRRALLLRAEAWRQTEHADEAAAIYRKLIAQAPSAGAYHGLGLMAAKRGELPEAERLLRQANRLAPIDVRILNDLGYVQLLIDQRAEARLSLSKAAELDSGNRQVGANLALYHLLQNDPEQAERTMRAYELNEEQKSSIRQDADRLFRK